MHWYQSKDWEKFKPNGCLILVELCADDKTYENRMEGEREAKFSFSVLRAKRGYEKQSKGKTKLYSVCYVRCCAQCSVLWVYASNTVKLLISGKINTF